MNAPIRRLSTFTALLFAALLVSTTLIQFVYAKSLNARPDNRRTLLASYARERGQILVGDTAIAKSVPTRDQYKWQRVYPQKDTYASITGYYSFYGAGGGLELAENALLSGQSDKLFYRRMSDLFTGRKPAGANLELTIDPKVQEAALAALGDQKGAAVALDPKTGAILALVSRPAYDPNVLATHDLGKVKASYDRLNKDPRKPLTDRAIAGDLYPPGSTFKIVTAAAALASQKYSGESEMPGPARLDLPETTATLPNHPPVPCGPGGRTTFLHAFQESCNSTFGWLGLELGDTAIREMSAKFGMGDELSVPMRVTPSRFPAKLNRPQLAQSAIGQYDVRATPLQVAMWSAAVANHGTVMKPYLVKSVLGSDLSVIDTTDPERLSEAMSPEVATQLAEMMKAVVEKGTGTKAQIDGVEVAGKTGTAQHGNGKRAHAWFTGYAPANDPKIAVAVIVEEGGNTQDEVLGGRVAAPIARTMMKAAIEQ